MTRPFTLDDKYTLEEGVVYVNGIQALVRLPIEQMRRDQRAGLRTGAFISGYEGSPLGGYDIALQRAQRLLDQHNIHFVPGVNEDLAATAVMGSQIHQLMPDTNVDGVVGIWYGKGPGVDRSGDVLRHANLAGTGKHCGALALAGDDHVSKSSTIPHQSELSFYNFAIPALTAGSPQEILDYGLYGIAMSRFTGAWTGLKLATDVCDGGGTLEVSPDRCPTIEPELIIDGVPYEKVMKPRLIVPISLGLEKELHYKRLVAAREFARANRLNVIKVSHRDDKLGIITAGKAYYDVMSALRNLGVDDEALERSGIRILKLGMVYPLESSIIDEFTKGLHQVLVIEEKRSFIEMQLRDLLFNANPRPAIYGKNDPDGRPLFPADGELDAEIVAQGLARWLEVTPAIERRLAQIAERETPDTSGREVAPRAPTFCSGCPHNRSTILLDGQIAGGGIGCHGMAARFKDNRGVAYLAQMGGEGAAWIGMSPFTEREHIFQNIGEGTYFHSGRMAFNAAIAAGVNVTFKILYNGAVAMTGGQEVAGGLPIPALTRELHAAGARRIVLVTDDLSRYEDRSQLADATDVRPREDLEDVLAELGGHPGVTVMIYDQMCAAEKRRRRNRGRMPQPVRRIMINERVCEGCGDCVTQSNCVSLHPVATEFGAKTRVHQSSCNADYSCAAGDCPSFVSVMIDEGTDLKRKPLPDLPDAAIEEPAQRVAFDGPYHVLMPGIGGTGVVTMNALLATAALLDGFHTITLDQTGLAQKGGAVVSHLTISAEPLEAANRVSYAATDLLLGFDVMGAAAATNIKRAHPERTVAVINSHETPTADSVRKGLTVISVGGHFLHVINRSTIAERNILLDTSKLAEKLFGSHLQSNILLMGVAYQAGLLPISAESIEESLRLNGVAVDRNLAAFRWGRKYQQDPATVLPYVTDKKAPVEIKTLDELIDHRAGELSAYQNEKYAAEYRSFVGQVRQAEKRVRPGSTDLADATARYLYKLMAYKDEYEVARLLTDPAFEQQYRDTFESPRKIIYHLHPPVLRALGLKNKLALGPQFRPLLRLLAGFKFLRGSALDVLGWAKARRQERELIGWYRETIESVLASLSDANLDRAVEIARLPDQIRGYENIKSASIEKVQQAADERLADLVRPTAA